MELAYTTVELEEQVLGLWFLQKSGRAHPPLSSQWLEGLRQPQGPSSRYRESWKALLLAPRKGLAKH